MGQLLYYLLIKPLSFLPLAITHRFSTVLSWLMFSVTGYRRKVVMHNLSLAFPEKTEAERKKIGRDFYRSLCDTIVESIRFFSISEKELRRRFRFTNPELLAPYAERGQSVILVGGHTTNFEIAALGLGPIMRPFQAMGIYSPLKNQRMDDLIFGNRRRMGTLLVSRRKVKEYFENPPNSLSADVFVADQSPSNAYPENLHWTEFMTQITGFVAGPERYAVRYDRPIYYLYLRRWKRGHYEVTAERLSDDPASTQAGEITERYARTLEREIRSRPASWLWTHRRWKRGVPDEIKEKWPPAAGYLPPQYDRERKPESKAR